MTIFTAKFEKFYFLFHASLCFAGLLYQTWLICILYFQYKVTTSIEIYFPDTIPPHAVTFCTRFSDVLDFDKLNRETGRNWSYSLDYTMINRYHNELTVAQMFRYTPANHELLKKVIYRNRSHLSELNDKEVPSKMRISKFLFLDHVCYKIGFKSNTSYTYNNVAVNLVSPGEFYKLHFSRKLIRSQYVRILLSVTFPHRSLAINPVINRVYNETEGTVKANHFTSYVQKVDVDRLLPAPYETNCFDYKKGENEITCAHQCIEKEVMEKFAKVPYSIYIHNESLTEKVIGYLDMQNAETEKDIDDIQKDCFIKKCKKKACKSAIVSTITTSSQRPGKDEAMTVKYTVPLLNWTRIRVNASLSSVELFLYLLSIISTWTGLSIFTMNPVTFWLNHCKRFQKKRSTTSNGIHAEHSAQRLLSFQEKRQTTFRFVGRFAPDITKDTLM